MNVLVTGGAGYIGSHTAVELLDQGHSVIIIDNLLNSNPESVQRITAITGKKVIFYETDVQNQTKLESIFSTHQIDAVIHFAGLKSVSESIKNPLLYYQNNIQSTLVLCEVMQKYNVKTANLQLFCN